MDTDAERGVGLGSERNHRDTESESVAAKDQMDCFVAALLAMTEREIDPGASVKSVVEISAQTFSTVNFPSRPAGRKSKMIIRIAKAIASL